MSTATVLKPVTLGGIVLFNGCYYRVSRLTSKTVNLSGVWGGRCEHKGVSVENVTEASQAHWEEWQNSEAYMSM